MDGVSAVRTKNLPRHPAGTVIMEAMAMRVVLGVAVIALLGIIGAAISRRFPPPREIRRVAPETSFPPAIEGEPIVGQTLRAGKGLWRHNPTRFAYQWMRCDASGENCLDIPGATRSTHVLKAADLAHTILVLVTASNSVGSLTVNSHPTDVAVRVPGGGRSALLQPPTAIFRGEKAST